MKFYSCEKQIFKSFGYAQAATRIHDQFFFTTSTSSQILTIPLLTEEALFTWAFQKWDLLFKYLQNFIVAYQ